jgi:hypothetical protein
MKGVLLMIVKLPVSPGGAFATGIFVGPGRTMNDWPFMMEALAPGIIGPREAAGAAKVVGAGTTIKGVPPMFVVSPVRPGGAASAGIFVGPGIITCGEGTGCGAGTGAGAAVVAGGPPNMELIIAPKAGGPAGVTWG